MGEFVASFCTGSAPPVRTSSSCPISATKFARHHVARTMDTRIRHES
jgi:hypothetical protein